MSWNPNVSICYFCRPQNALYARFQNQHCGFMWEVWDVALFLFFLEFLIAWHTVLEWICRDLDSWEVWQPSGIFSTLFFLTVEWIQIVWNRSPQIDGQCFSNIIADIFHHWDCVTSKLHKPLLCSTSPLVLFSLTLIFSSTHKLGLGTKD